MARKVLSQVSRDKARQRESRKEYSSKFEGVASADEEIQCPLPSEGIAGGKEGVSREQARQRERQSSTSTSNKSSSQGITGGEEGVCVTPAVEGAQSLEPMPPEPEPAAVGTAGGAVEAEVEEEAAEEPYQPPDSEEPVAVSTLAKDLYRAPGIGSHHQSG